MNLKNKKRLVQSLLGIGKKRIKFDPEKLSEIKEAITKLDIRGLAKDGAITVVPEHGISRGRHRSLRYKRKRGQGKGQGKRKGKKTARLARKTKWINTIRSQRKLLAELKDSGKIAHQTYRELYLKAKGGYFRNMRHIKLYLEEQKLLIAEVKS